MATKHIQLFLQEVENKVIPRMQKILDVKQRNASGTLRKSFEILIKKSTKGFDIVLTFAQQGYGVLRSKRKYTKRFPSSAAIDAIMKWIQQKHISVGGGATRSATGESHVTTRRKAQQTKNNPIRQFAIAIWLKNKQRGRIATPSTDFLRPYRDYHKTKTFQTGIKDAMKNDAIAIIQSSKFSKQTITLKA